MKRLSHFFSKRGPGSLIAAVLLCVLSLLYIGAFASAHSSGSPHEEPSSAYTADGVRLDEYFTRQSWQLVFGTSIILTVVTIVALVKQFMGERFRKVAFLLLVLPTIGTTLYLAGTTVYLNVISSSGGPVHWHADFILSYCGTQLDLKDPTGLSNRIGTPVLHEHNDNRIHVEGVVLEPYHVNLKSFFEVIGGTMTKNAMIIPTNDGPQVIQNGDVCPDGRSGRWQAFVYQTNPETGFITQQKLDDFPNYIPSPYGVVPPADCLIFEFTPDIKARTDKICGFYQIEIEKGNFHLK